MHWVKGRQWEREVRAKAKEKGYSMASVTTVRGMDTQPSSAQCLRKAKVKERVRASRITEIVGIVDRRVT